MDDLISRQAALEKVRAMQTYKLFMGDDMILVDKAEVQTELMMLPSAQPERMRGKWIDDGDPFMWECGCCGYRVKRYNNTRYCPNCGAEMREVSE